MRRTVASSLARTTIWREGFVWKQPNDFLLLPTCTYIGEQALDDDALGGILDGVVEEKRKGRKVAWEGVGRERVSLLFAY